MTKLPEHNMSIHAKCPAAIKFNKEESRKERNKKEIKENERQEKKKNSLGILNDVSPAAYF
jgi:hypothetical protein